jgi:hypothetical protein
VPETNMGIINYGRIGGDASVKVQTKHVGDAVSIYGTASNVNVKSGFERSQQTVEVTPILDEAAKRRLLDLTRALGEALAQVPQDHAEVAETVMQQAEALAGAAAAEKPNPALMHLIATGFLKAAKAVGQAAPAVLAISKDLVGLLKQTGVL